jgi:hypothetical protein
MLIRKESNVVESLLAPYERLSCGEVAVTRSVRSVDAANSKPNSLRLPSV